MVGSSVNILQEMGLRTHTHTLIKVTWLISRRTQILILPQPEILNPRVYFFNHHTTSVNIKGKGHMGQVKNT